MMGTENLSGFLLFQFFLVQRNAVREWHSQRIKTALPLQTCVFILTNVFCFFVLGNKKIRKKCIGLKCGLYKLKTH